MRDYVQRNFVDKGMCADWAIHDSEYDKAQSPYPCTAYHAPSRRKREMGSETEENL